ncbi:MAG: flavocytochrome c [Dehalococcoidia bacterium]|nr:MAG: flavocytochrome c [Dehalococcoidia bacterium]
MTHLIIVGAGNAGLPAAIEAADLGARVTLIEQSDRVGGTLWRSSAIMSGAGTRMQRAKGYHDSPQAHFEDCLAIGRGRNDSALLRLATTVAAETIDWLQDLGVPFTEDSPRFAPEHELYTNPRSHYLQPFPGTQAAGINAIIPLERELKRRIAAGKVTLRLATRVVALLCEEGTGAVIGVRTRGVLGEEAEVRGDAVILATGGYAGNLELMRRLHPQFSHVITLAPREADGSGMLLAEQVGAALTNMDLLIPLPGGVPDPRVPGECLYWVMIVNQRAPAEAGDIYVNKLGKRYIREDEKRPDVRERALMEQPDTCMIAVFDEPMREGLTERVSLFTKRELEGGRGNPNVVISAPTIEALAARLGIDPPTLRATVDRYNTFVIQGVDEDFGREKMPKAIDTPPFHAVVTYGVVLGTMGGVKVNERLEVLRPDGRPVPGLYAAGEVLGKGQIMGDGLCSGFAAGPAFSFGRLAARNALAARATARV